MKRILILGIVFLMLFTLVACDTETDTTPDSDTQTQAQQQPETPEDTTIECQHSFTEWSVIKQATCLEDGQLARVCKICADIEKTTIGRTNSHVEVTAPATAPTCTAAGLTEGKQCAVCGTILVAQTVIPMASHTYDNDYDNACNLCGYVRDVGCGHTEKETLKGKAATCTTAGLTDGKKCKKCGEILVAQTTISAFGHREVIDAFVAPTCTATGLTEGKHCSVCSAVFVAQTSVPMVGHTYDNAYDESCNVCGGIRGVACAHTETETITGKAATCTEAGVTDGIKCKKCGEIIVAQTTIKALGHAEVIDKAVSATCATDGKTEGKHCSRCGIVTVKQEIVKATKHNIEGDKCSLCNKSCEELCVNFYDMSSQSDGTVMCYVLESPDKIGFYCVYIVGEGPMRDYSAGRSPLKLDGYNTKITQLIFSEGITSIGSHTFEFCDYIVRINIPSTVTSIGQQAFYECNSLTYITLSENIQKVESYAFYHTAHYNDTNNWYGKQNIYSRI